MKTTLSQTDYIIETQKKEIELLKKEIKSLREELDLNERECTEHCDLMHKQADMYCEIEKALSLACSEIEYHTGSCPVDVYDWDTDKDCQNLCDTGIAKECWIEYYKELAIKDRNTK